MSRPLDILFVNPGDRREIYQDLGDDVCAIEPPVFCNMFADYARRKGYSVEILDVPAEWISAEEAARRIEEDYQPALVAIVVYGFQPSASTQNMTAAGKIAKLVKEANPSRPVLMTGTHPAALPEKTLVEEAVDFVVDREGPVTIAKTVDALRAGTSSPDVPSLWWKDADGMPHAPTSTEPLLKDVDAEMPGGAWDLLDMSRYRAHNWHCFDHITERSPYASIHTSLGCPYKCTFCCINAPFGTNAYRLLDPETVVRQIDFLVETYGVKNIKFVDEMFVLNKRHVLGICDRLIDRDYKVNIWAYARVDTVKDEFLDKLKAAGFNWLCLGIEAANSTVRDGADKKFSDEDIIDTCRRIQSHGIYIIANYIVGLPQDTFPRMQQTLDLALEINAEFANFYSAMAYPGSQLYTAAVQEKRELPKLWAHFSQHGFNALPLRNEYLSASDILWFRDHAFQVYFSNPSYLAMLERKFGKAVVDHVEQFRKVPLARALLTNERVVDPERYPLAVPPPFPTVSASSGVAADAK